MNWVLHFIRIQIVGASHYVGFPWIPFQITKRLQAMNPVTFVNFRPQRISDWRDNTATDRLAWRPAVLRAVVHGSGPQGLVNRHHIFVSLLALSSLHPRHLTAPSLYTGTLSRTQSTHQDATLRDAEVRPTSRPRPSALSSSLWFGKRLQTCLRSAMHEVTSFAPPRPSSPSLPEKDARVVDPPWNSSSSTASRARRRHPPDGLPHTGLRD